MSKYSFYGFLNAIWKYQIGINAIIWVRKKLSYGTSVTMSHDFCA